MNTQTIARGNQQRYYLIIIILPARTFLALFSYDLVFISFYIKREKKSYYLCSSKIMQRFCILIAVIAMNKIKTFLCKFMRNGCFNKLRPFCSNLKHFYLSLTHFTKEKINDDIKVNYKFMKQIEKLFK